MFSIMTNMFVTIFSSTVDTLCSALVLICSPFIYLYNLICVLFTKIFVSFNFVINFIFGVIGSVISVICSPFVLLFRLLSDVCGILFSIVTAAIHDTILVIFNALFTSAQHTDSWWEFVQNLQPTIILVLLLLALLLLQHLRTHRILKKERWKFDEELVAYRRKTISSHIRTSLEFILEEASRHIKPSQPLPNVDTKISLRLADCHVTALDGVIEHLDSLHLDTAVTRRLSDGTLVLRVAAGMRQVCVRYDRYTVLAPLKLLPPFYASGHITVTVSPVILRVEVSLGSPFSAHLDSLDVSEMGPLKVDVTGLGDWDVVWRMFGWLVMPSVGREVKRQIKLQATPIVKEVLRNLTRTVSDIPMFQAFEEETGNSGDLPSAPRDTLCLAYFAAIGAIIASGFGIFPFHNVLGRFTR